jgi:hypothetical protein
MNLQDGIVEVRDAIGEPTPFNWQDSTIIGYLNQAAKRMCSAAQWIEEFEEIPVGANVQEGYLTKNVDQILEVGYYSGTFFRLTRGDFRNVKDGSYSGGIPVMFYERKATRTLTPQVSTSNITPVVAPGASVEGCTAIGVYPVPAAAWSLYVWYIAEHPKMVNYEDPCFVPTQWQDVWTAYAIYKCKEKESAYAECAYFQEKWNDGMAAWVTWAKENGLASGPRIYGGQYGILGKPSTSVIVVADNPGYTNM